MKNITLSAEAHLIAAARQRAIAEHSTLNEQFRIWLAKYARQQEQLKNYDKAINELSGKLNLGHKLTREEMNER